MLRKMGNLNKYNDRTKSRHCMHLPSHRDVFFRRNFERSKKKRQRALNSGEVVNVYGL